MLKQQTATHNMSILNECPVLLQGPDLLHDLVAPSSTAVAIDFLEDGSKRRRFSYKTLHTLSDSLAQKICKSLEKLENASVIIPVLLPQCPELYIVLLAILKAGKAFCPLSLDAPKERLDFILKDVSADLLITDSARGRLLNIKSDIITLYVDQDSFREDQHSSLTLASVHTSDLAYVLYTSGSTGRPKAVSVSHRAVTQSLLAHDRHIPHFTRFLQFAAPTFDVSIFEIFFPWYRGCTLASRTRTRMLDNLPESIRALDVDAAELTPTVVSNLLQGRSSVPSLKLLLTIGEMLTQDVIKEYGSSPARDGILWAMYGPTEAAIHCTLQPHLSATASTQMIGFPLDTVSAFIVASSPDGEQSSAFSILPIGEEGELVIGGHQIAEEYLNRPELTVASFMHHPQYGPLYRTGDRARLRDNGTLECLGRVTVGQVKFRGQRIELGEIEQIVLKVEGCRAATVKVIDEVLVAFCATGSRKVSHADVLQTCKRWLPSIMIPTDVIFISRMPQSSSGKVDQGSLIAMYRQTSQENYSEKSDITTSAGHTVLELLRYHLKRDLAPESNLRSVGLDSLRVIRLASAIRAEGYQVTAVDILRATVVEDILRIAKATGEKDALQVPEEKNFTEDMLESYPELHPWHEMIACTLSCTPLQEAMLAETVARPSAYCNWIEVELTELHSFDDIKVALRELANANEILRSGFCPAVSQRGNFVQVVWRELDDSQIQDVRDFTRHFSLSSRESLLRPLLIQLGSCDGKPRLLFQIHHALYDGWSLDLILQDLENLLHGNTVKQRPQYREVVKYHSKLTELSTNLDKDYWTELLRDRTEASLPNFNGRIVEHAATEYFVGRSTVDVKDLLERSHELNVSPQVYFQAASAFVSSLYVGSSDIVIGNVSSGRTIPVTGVDSIIGPCIASLPFRLRFGSLATVQDILYETQRQNREGLEHCSLPLREIAKVANVHEGTRLFDVLFVWQQSIDSIADSSTAIRIVESADELEFRITLEFEPHPDHISFRATFRSSAISDHQVDYLFRQIDEVVHCFLKDIGTRTTEIVACFSTAVCSIANSVPRQRKILYGPAHAVERWAAVTPHKAALSFFHSNDGAMRPKSTATYASLNSRTNQLARALSGQGVRQGCLVGIVMEKSMDLYAAILAVLKLGAGYLPLVPDLPEERVKIILRESQVAVCIADSSTSFRLQQLTSSTVVDISQVDIAAYADNNIETSYRGTDIAYAVFTSGSTGSPKGVLITQDNLMSNLEYLSTIYPYSGSSRLLQACSQAFDVSVFEIFFSWHVGICLCTAKKDDLFSDLEATINQLDITHLSLTPTVAALINPDNVPRVEFLVTAGEAVTEHVRRNWAGRGLFQGYGPSETTNICTVRPFVSPSDLINNIGSPFDNTSALVLDPASNVILPRGAVGELCFGGHQVFQGYLNRPDLTAAKVFSHPTYGRIYRSGDLGTLLADDSILFAGRLDDQVKIRGQRVELGEISAIILDQECARDCATLLLQSSSSPDILATFWVPMTVADTSFRLLSVQDFRPDMRRMCTALSQRLPSYMLPSHLIPVSLLPMTTQGKIDKRRLQACFESLTDEDMDRTTFGHDAPDGDTAAFTTWELQVAQRLAELLGLTPDSIRRNSSFFSSGLDSVSAISFANHLRKANLGDFTISEIMKNSTIARLATLKETRGVSGMQSKSSTICIEKAITPSEVSRIRKIFEDEGRPIAKIQPCTPLQEVMLSSNQSTSDSSYTNVMVFSINGDLPRLQDSWALMVRRHEILRTAFVATNDPSFAFVQVVLEDVSLQWSEVNWSTGPYRQANRTISGLVHANRPPAWLAIAKSEPLPRLLFCCHHAMYDGLAIQRLLSEVQDAYHNRELLPPISHEVYLQRMLAQDYATADEFWTAAFRDFEPTTFPDLTGQVHKESRTSGSWHLRMQQPLSKIREACQRASVTLLSAIHATWAKLLYFYTGESDLCFGTVVSGRGVTGHDLERLIAPCFNTLPVRIDINLQDDNLALVRQAHAFNIDSIVHQLTPLRRIQTAVLKDGGQLFDTLIILQQPSEPLDSTVWALEAEYGDMDLPLVCEISQDEAEDQMHITIHYHSTTIHEKEAVILAETFEESLVTILGQPHALADDTSGLPRRLRSESNLDMEHIEHDAQYLHSGFERNVQLYPNRIALDFLYAAGPRTTWSFKTLHHMAEHVMHALLHHDTKPGDIVPVHISKSPDFYACTLGILKAGAAFAPVHPDLPEARRRLMLKDLNPKVVLHAGQFTLPGISDNVTLLDVGALEYPRRPSQDTELTSSSLAYCIFTSGSTGVPKAVGMEHHAPIQTIESSRSRIPWNNSSRLLQYAATTFDMCYYDCFLAWTLGFTLCAAEQDMMLNELPTVINTLNVDLLDLTPSVATSLVRYSVPNVKWLYCIGEVMTPDIVKEWEGACINSYGPSEAAFCTTIYPVSKDVKSSIIGKPFPSTSFAIYSSVGDQILPLLSIGELYIGGAQLARGYHGRPDLTAEKFMTKSEQRFYRSGDMVRMLSDGNFEFIGRKDDQVKIRGLRVELGEINIALQDAHPTVITAVTQILKKDATAREQLVAFLVAHDDNSDCDHEQLRRHLRSVLKNRLPSYMVPQFFIFMDKIPRSLAGKVNKQALEECFRNFAGASTVLNGPSQSDEGHSWSRLESCIRHIFAHLSNSQLDDISPITTIYQLGLDSISAVQIATALRKEGHSVNAADVMKYLTCAELAAYIELNATSEMPALAPFNFDSFDGEHRSQVISSCGVADKDIVAIRPCTPLQKGMLSQMLAKEGAIYVNYLRLSLDSGTSRDRLKHAWKKTMFMHQLLRTGFVQLVDKDHPFAMIEYTASTSAFPWEVVSKNDVVKTPEVWLEELQRRAVVELHRPLWKIRIVREKNIEYLDLAMFHALFDAQSLRFIFRDVAAAYDGQDFKLPTEISPVIGGILQRSTGYGEQAKEFWTQMGKQATPCRFPNLAPLRYAREQPAICTHRSKMSMKEIEDSCRRSNTSLQAAGVASWLSLIAGYTGESTATCGVVLSGRSFGDAENAVFPCINTVPLAQAVRVGSKDMLEVVTSKVAEIQQYQHVPLTEIQKLMGYQNEALFDTIFAYQKLPISGTDNLPWSVADEKATIEYPLSVELEPNGDHLVYRLTYMPHTIPREQASLMLRQLDHLFQHFIFGSERNDIFDTSLYAITPAKEPSLPSEALLLHQFVELTAMEHPQRTAFEFAASIYEGDYSATRWAYSELDAEGNKVANLLIENGVQPGDLVGVCFDKCPEASFAMLGVLKAGAAFVAIDPGAPTARQIFTMQDSGAAAVLSLTAQSACFRQSLNIPILDLDDSRRNSLSSAKPALCRDITPQDRSYCLYTSGTTGNPKGCELTHENAVQAILSFQRLFSGHWNAGSRWLQFASFHFDVSVLEQYWSWSVGICVVSAPRDVIFEDLANSINTLGITHIDLTPSLAQMLHPDEVPSLCKGVFITGGESLKQEILDVWGPKAVIYNGYGPTEATIGCTMYPRVPTNGKPSNIGRQFDNVGTFVLQPGSDVPVLRGGIGELCVSGKLVGKGYLGREDLTKKSFPYLERFRERVYRTGDLVRILYDETFDFLGRADDQIKLRGQRLEIGEINSVIRQSNSNITDVATLVLKHPRQQKEQLVAFVVQSRTKGDPKVWLANASDILSAKDACHDRLPPYMVPTHFIPLTSLPLNINNKADVKRLKEIYGSLSATDLQKLTASSDEHRESLTSLEMKIRAVVMEELNVDADAIHKDTSFFELGMDSISVISMVRALKQAGVSRATASLVMKNSSLRRAAKAVSGGMESKADRASLLAAQQAITAIQHRHRHTVAQSLSISTSDIEAVAPCTPLQQGMIARSLESQNGLYFNRFQFELSQDVDDSRLRSAWQAVFTSTQTLRTVFTETEDGFLQAVIRSPMMPWAAEAPKKDESMEDCLSRLRHTWFQNNSNDLSRPFEVILLTAPYTKLLIVHVFHGLYDGVSIEIIFEAVWNSYYGSETNKEAPSFQTALAYGPLRSVVGAKDFWQKHLSSDLTRVPSLPSNIPDSRSVKVVREFQGLVELEERRRQLNVTAQAIAQACWLSVLQQWHTKSTTTTGVIVSGRSIDLDGADRVLGPMFNTIPYQHNSQQSETWSAIIKRVHEFNVAVHPYQHTPLRDISKWCQVDRSRSLFNSLFSYQVVHGKQCWADNELWRKKDGEDVADYPISLEVEQRSDNAWKLTLLTQSYAYNEATSNELLDKFETALRKAVEDPTSLCNTMSEVDHILEYKPNMERQVLSLSQGTNDFEWTMDAKTLRNTLAELTNVSLADINESTSIFELGLDSIDAIKLSSKLRKSGVHLPVSEIMRSLSISKMLPNITKSSETSIEQGVDFAKFELRKRELRRYMDKQDDINMSQVEDVLPLTPLQEAMVAEMMSSDFERYFNFDVMKLEEGTDLDRLQSAWTQVVEASPILRTSFAEINDPKVVGSFVQIIHSKPHSFWSTLTIDNEPDFPSLFEEVRKQITRAPSSEPPFCILLVECTNQAHIILAISHALYDGWSLGLLHADVNNAYNGTLQPRHGYQTALSEILATSEANAAIFWGNYLYEAPSSTFNQQANALSPNVVHRLEQKSKTGLDSMTKFARTSNIPLQALVQSAFTIVLASYVRSLDVTFGSVVSGRDDETRSQLLFPVMNTIAIRTILHGSSLELLRHVRDGLTNIKQWQHFPLQKALAFAGVHGDLFQSLFIFQKSIERDRKKEQALYTSVDGHSDVEYPVCVETEVMHDHLIWRCAVENSTFDKAGAKELLDTLDKVLNHLMECPDEPVIEFTSDGISLCGLPPFESNGRSYHTSTGMISEDEGHHDDESHQDTVRTIREVLAVVSDIPEIGITDDMTIFHMGLDSISAIKVSSLLRHRGVILSVGEMVRAGSVGRMAHIANARSPQQPEVHEDYETTLEETLQDLRPVDLIRSANLEGCHIEDITKVRILPATAGQVYMVSMWLNTGGNNFYPEFTYKIKGEVSFDTLQNAWNTLVAATPILRTYFVATQDRYVPYVQIAHNSEERASTIVNISSHANKQATQAVKQPWAHLYVAQIEDGWQIKLKIHHALYDGVSLPLLIQQFQDICNGNAVSSSEKAIEKLVSGFTTCSTLEVRMSFWKNYLHGLDQSYLSQPESMPNKKIEIFSPKLVSSTSLEDTARHNGVSIQSVFLAAYARLHAKLTEAQKHQDVVIGIYLANRSFPIAGIETAAIPTINLLPLRVCTSPQKSLIEAAKRIQQDLQRVGEPTHASASLFEINEWTSVKVDTFVNFLTLPDAGTGKEGETHNKNVKIISENKWERKKNAIIDHSAAFQPRNLGQLEHLSDNKINKVYLHAIDVEATIQNGSLDVGIFAPVEMLSLAAGNKLLEDLKAGLERACE